MVELSEKAEKVLMSASHRYGDGVRYINRTLGYKTWATKGERGARADIAELYRHGLIAEYWHPWSPPVYLTEKGETEFKRRRVDGMVD